MRITSQFMIGLIFCAGFISGSTFTDTVAAQPEQSDQCSTPASVHLRTTLYFGMARPNGSVTELEWQQFLRDEVSARFPDGLTVWEADGQWRTSHGTIAHERTKVLLLVHPDTTAARDAVRTIIRRYSEAFDQQSVLWESARVFVAS